MVTIVQNNTVAFPAEKSALARQRVLDSNQHTAARLRLSNMLQTTLDLTQVLELFFEEVQQTLSVASLKYINDESQNNIDLGERQRHSCRYKLITQRDNLGELVFTRIERFSEEELQTLETLLGSLVCPIRNALMYQQAIDIAMKDPLTGAGNRLSMEATLGREIGLAARHQLPLSILVVDIDHFKNVNDTYGHAKGDIILKNVARELMDSCRDTDATFRFGGEEFVVVLNRTDRKGAHISAERVRQQIANMNKHYNDQDVAVTVSIGISSLQPKDSINSLFERADKALYEAKRQGRDRVVLAEEDNIPSAIKV
jgi:diguanylate cyclase (GGDEF)-like protein